MKALTVKNPWAWAIVHAGKNVENRSLRTRHRGLLYIHASKAYDSQALRFPAFSNLDLDFDVTGEAKEGIDIRGMVIGTVDVTDCHHADECAMDNDEGRRVYCSEWAMAGQHHWVLANPRAVEIPFEAKGMLGLWNLDKVPA